MASAVINLQNRFLRIIEAEFDRHEAAKIALEQAHPSWVNAVCVRIGQINASLIVAGQPGNQTVIATTMQAYQTASGGSADASLLAPIPELLFTCHTG